MNKEVFKKITHPCIITIAKNNFIFKMLFIVLQLIFYICQLRINQKMKNIYGP